MNVRWIGHSGWCRLDAHIPHVARRIHEIRCPAVCGTGVAGRGGVVTAHNLPRARNTRVTTATLATLCYPLPQCTYDIHLVRVAAGTTFQDAACRGLGVTAPSKRRRPRAHLLRSGFWDIHFGRNSKGSPFGAPKSAPPAGGGSGEGIRNFVLLRG